MKLPLQVEALLIDMDGTLIDSLTTLYEVYKTFLKKYEIKGSEQEFLQLNGPSLNEILHTLKQRYQLKEDLEMLVNQYQQELLSFYSEGLPIFPHARETVLRAKSFGLKVALVSSAPKKLMEVLVQSLNMENDFDILISSEQVKRGKPAPDLYQYALHYLGVLPERAIAIEDSVNGVRSAQEAGVCVLWISPKKYKESLCIQVSDWLAIDKLLESYYA